MNTSKTIPGYRHALLLSFVLLVSACGSPEQRSQTYYERGMALIDKKDDLAARLELLNAVKYKSDKIEAWRALAGINERTKFAQGLFDNLRRIVELDPTDTEARIKLGTMLLAGGAADAALRLVESAPDSSGQNAALRALKASILGNLKDTAGAQVEAGKASELDAGNVEAAITLASGKMAQGDAEGALNILGAPTITAKGDYRTELARAQIFAQKRDFPQAEIILQSLVGRRPDDALLRTSLAQVYIAQRRFDEAEKELRLNAKANPESTKAQLDLVRFLISLKGPAAGKEELAARINAGGEVFPYQIELAELDFTLGNFEDSFAQLKRLVDGPGPSERPLAAQAKLAELQLRKGNFSEAEATAGEILRKDPRNVTGLKIRAAIRIEQGQVESAIGDIREALNGQPKAPELLLLLATAYEKDKKPELAERQYADAVKASAGNSNYTLRYASFLQRRGQLTQAEDVLNDAVIRTPRDLQLLSSLAQLRLLQKNWAGALAVADTISSIGNDRGIASQVKAAAYAGQNKKEESIAALEAAHASAPDAIQPVNSLVTALLQSGKPEKAEALLDDLLKKYPNASQLSLLMGSTQLAKNDMGRATSYFKAAISQQPSDPAGYAALSTLYTRQKNFEEASRILKEGINAHPNNLNLRLALSGTMILQSDYEGAISIYESILKQQPDNPIAANNLASLLLDHRTDKKDLDRAATLAEGNKGQEAGEFNDTLGWARYNRGDYQAAVVALEDAVAKLPNSASIRYHLGMSYKALGDTKKAMDQLNAAQSLEPDGTALKGKIRAAL